jgi:hypothetical protein
MRLLLPSFVAGDRFQAARDNLESTNSQKSDRYHIPIVTYL